MSKNISWEYKRTPVTDEVLDEKERLLGIRLPEDFRRVFIENHGAGPIPEYYYLNGRSMNFGTLVTLEEDEEEVEFVEANTNIDREEIDMPESVIIFAIDPAGNFLCFDYREQHDGYPIIIFWDHEVEGGDAEKICNTFAELQDMLHEYEEEED